MRKNIKRRKCEMKERGEIKGKSSSACTKIKTWHF
jgi:hypothetical protein